MGAKAWASVTAVFPPCARAGGGDDITHIARILDATSWTQRNNMRGDPYVHFEHVLAADQRIMEFIHGGVSDIVISPERDT